VYSAESSSGEVLLDDGVRLSFGAAALEGSELLLLRPGQRVHVEVDGTEVRSLAIIAR
jgi:hypothetical protein